MDKTSASLPNDPTEGSGAEGDVPSVTGSEPACRVQDLPHSLLILVLRRVSKKKGLGGPLHFALLCRRFAALRFRAAALSLPSLVRVPGPLLADQLQVYQGPTSLTMSTYYLHGLRALLSALAVQGPALRALHVYASRDTCVECEGECHWSHRNRSSQLCARSGQASAWWAFSGPFLRAHTGLRSLSIRGSGHLCNQQPCRRCCVCFSGSDSFVSVPELRSSLPRLTHLRLDAVNLGWPQDWPSALPSLKSLELRHYKCVSRIGHQGADCIFPWSVLEMTSLTHLSLQVNLPSMLDQDFGRLVKLKSLRLSLFQSPPSNAPDDTGATPLASLWTLTGLRSLSLHGTGQIPEVGLGRLVGLTELLLRDTPLGSLPLSLQALEIVELKSSLGRQGLQERLGRRGALRKLVLEDCALARALPVDFCELASLSHLTLSCLPKLEELPEGFGRRLHSLTSLWLKQCGSLSRLPADLGLLASLTELGLENLCSLEELPDGFGKLQSLRFLEIRCCKTLRRLPDDFGQLSSLTQLRLDDLEGLEELPEMSVSLGQLQKLFLIQLTGLRRSQQPGLVICELNEDTTPPAEEHAGSWGFAHLEDLRVINCEPLMVVPGYLQRLSSLVTLRLVCATRPGELDEDFLERIPSLTLRPVEDDSDDDDAERGAEELRS